MCDERAAESRRIEMIVLEHSATIATVEMAQDRVRFETEVRLKGDFLDDLIDGGGAAPTRWCAVEPSWVVISPAAPPWILLGVDDFDGSCPGGDSSRRGSTVGSRRFFARCSRYVSSPKARRW